MEKIRRKQWSRHDAVSIYRVKSVKQSGKWRDFALLSALTHLHMQEVTGSSSVVSTKKFLILKEIRGVSFILREIVGRFCDRSPPPQAVPHTGK